jgi:3alpha(or 20beta)-hydroxysteroid dehydrogenase
MLDEEKVIMADNPYFDFDEWLTKQPIPRLAQPEEISNLVKYLVSDASSYCTGAVWSLDGGMTAK